MARSVPPQLLLIALSAIIKITALPTESGFHFVGFPISNAGFPSLTSHCLLRIEAQPKRDDYTYVPGVGGYKIHTRAVLWAEARETCQDEGGHLAIINSVNESKTMSSIFKRSPAITGSELPEYVAIGFHDLYREGDYITIHEESVAKAGFDQWESGQPNNYDNQDCGAMNKDGLLNDLSCNKPNGFMCEIPEQQPYE